MKKSQPSPTSTKVHKTSPKGFKPTVHVSGVLLFWKNKFLILERDTSRPQALTWGVPSGKMEKGESHLQTAMREVNEEVGIPLKPKDLHFSGTFYVNHPDLDFCYHVYYSFLKKTPKIKLNLSEHLQARFVTYEESLAHPLIGGAKEVFDFCFDLVTPLKEAFEKSKNKEKADWQTAYMKHQFPFLGVAKPVRAKIQKELFKKHPIFSERMLLHIVKSLWNEHEREYLYAAIDLLIKHQKLWSKALLPFIKKLLSQKSWWDTVDLLSSKVLGKLLLEFPDLQNSVDDWIYDKNLWIRRSALLYQLSWKKKTDEKRLFNYCLHLSSEKDFFIRKAIGWALRQYAKTNQKAVKDFIRRHTSSLSTLSIREASSSWS